MDWMGPRLAAALIGMSNTPLFPFNKLTSSMYSALLIYAAYLYRPDLVDISNRITTGSSFYDLHTEYDFIIVGGGSAGCVLANRLSENPKWTVLLLEAGGGELLETEITLLSNDVRNRRDINWDFQSQKSSKYAFSQNNVIFYPRGKIIGGCSVLNTMMYIRGNKKDFDKWRDMGNTGWSYYDVLSYFKKSENMRIPALRNSTYHGVDGYLSVENFKYRFPIQDAIREASAYIGYEETDVNGANQTGFAFSPATIKNGFRDSTAKAFLRPIKNRPNLHISLDSYVTKILVHSITKMAVGVTFTKMFGTFNLSRSIYARKEVILSAGTVQSPQLLMLSGIGPAEHLIETQIQPILNLPGVGRNFHDHVAMSGITYIINNPPYAPPYGVSLVYPRVMTDSTIASFVKNASGPAYLIESSDSMLFVHSKYNTDPDWPDIQIYPQSGGECSDGGITDRGGMTQEAYDRVYKQYAFRFTISFSTIFLRPYSRGRIKLRDNDTNSPPMIYPNFYSDPRDLEIQIEGAKIAHSLTRTPALRKYNITLNPNRFVGCDSYEYLSDAFWKCMVLRHLPGHCKSQIVLYWRRICFKISPTFRRVFSLRRR